MTDIVKCARCGIDVPQKWAFIEEGDEWECPSCWHRCEEKELRDKIERLDAACKYHADNASKMGRELEQTQLDLAEAEALLRRANTYLCWADVYAWLARRGET